MNVGLTISEGVANGASAAKAPSKRNIGLLGQFSRGVSFKPQKITSMEDFNKVFGGQNSSFYGPGVVRSIFKEADEAPVTLYIARVTGSGSVVASGVATLVSPITMTVKAGYKGSDDPGSWANGVKVTLYSFSSRVRGMFTLLVDYKGTTEQYNYATLTEIQNAVNTVSKYITIAFSGEIAEKVTYTTLTGTLTSSTSSKIITGTDFTTDLTVGSVLFDADNHLVGTVASVDSDTQATLTSRALIALSAAQGAKKRNDSVYEVTLANGSDGSVTEEDFYPVEDALAPTGLACFNGVDVQIIAVTEYHSLTMAKQLNSFVNNAKSPLGVCNLPLNADEGTAELYANELQTNGRSFMAGAYLGWCYVADDDGNSILVPAIGPVLGAGYLKSPYTQGNGIHIPPAGIESAFKNVISMVPQNIDQSIKNRLVQEFSCNIIDFADGIGYYVASSRTYSTDPLYQSIHIRMQTSYYVRVLDVKMRYLVQKPNTVTLRTEALVKLSQFFKGEYDAGALETSVDFKTAYKGICDTSNNPVGQDRKILNIDCLWIPTECTESVVISLRRNDGILTTSETEA